MELISTFHSVYISTCTFHQKKYPQHSLHSTLFILVPVRYHYQEYQLHTLHSTLFILVPFLCLWIDLNIDSSTFHSVYISTKRSRPTTVSIRSLHSTLFILVRESVLIPFDSWSSTFHSVYISTIVLLLFGRWLIASTFHSVYISTRTPWMIDVNTAILYIPLCLY